MKTDWNDLMMEAEGAKKHCKGARTQFWWDQDLISKANMKSITNI